MKSFAACVGFFLAGTIASTIVTSASQRASAAADQPPGSTSLGLLQRVADLTQRVEQLERAQSSYKIKDVKCFVQTVRNDTTNKDSTVTLVFPQPVDFVALESLLNDGHDMHICAVDRVNQTTFNVHFLSARNQGVRWVPVVRFLGIQLSR
jgi:hypothetical protein